IAATTTFDTVTVSNNTGQDMYVCAYDLSGSALYGKGVGGSSVFGGDVTAGIDANPVLTGAFTTTAFFDGISVSGFGGDDCFVAKLYPGTIITGQIAPEDAGLGVRVFPNPVRHSLQIEWQGKGLSPKWEVRDMTGKIVREFTIYGQGENFDVSDLPAGLYLLTHPEKQVGIRFVKE
ncbi:MAG: T9SS type A sorting domain-containing protein, partial [Bacteroidota bacterium]